MRYAYYTPFYMPGFATVTPLANLGNTSVEFYQAKYRIRPECYKSRTAGGNYPPLENIFDYLGNDVFVTSRFDRRKYRLLSESRAASTPFYDEIVETYGYTPREVFNGSTSVAWTRPAMLSPNLLGNSGNGRIISLPDWNLDFGYGDIFSMTFSNYDGLVRTGDYICLWRPYTLWGIASWQPLSSNLIEVLYAHPGGARINMSSGSAKSYWTPIDDPSSGLTYPSVYLGSVQRFRDVSSRDFTAQLRISFFQMEDGGYPKLDNAMEIKIGSQVVNRIEEFSSPTYAEYSSMMEKGTLIKPLADTYERLIGDVYKKTEYFLPAQ